MEIVIGYSEEDDPYNSWLVRETDKLLAELNDSGPPRKGVGED